MRNFIKFALLSLAIISIIACGNNNQENRTSEDNQNTSQEIDTNKAGNDAVEDNDSTEPLDGEVDLDEIEGDNLEVTREVGEKLVIRGENLAIPKEFPEDIPVIDDINIIKTYATDEYARQFGSTPHAFIQYEYEGDFEELVDMYDAYISTDNFDEIITADDSEPLRHFEADFSPVGNAFARVGKNGNASTEIRFSEDQRGLTTVNINYDEESLAW